MKCCGNRLNKYRSILLRPKADSKFLLFTKLMDSRRAKRTSVYTSIVGFRREFEKLASLSESSGEEQFVSDAFFHLALLRYLNLSGTHVADFKRRLVIQMEKKESYDELLTWFSNNNDVEDTIREEKQDVSRKGFQVDANNEEQYTMGILDAPSGYGGKTVEHSSKSAFQANSQEDVFDDLNSGFYKFSKVFWPGSEVATSYNPATFFNTFLGKKTNSKGGLNRFPPGFEKRGKTRTEQKKNLATDMAKALGSNCTRCFRKCCDGSTTGWRDAPCAQEGTKEYVSYEICMTIFHLMKYLAKTDSCQTLVTNFYNTKGTNICTEKHMPSYCALLVKSTSDYSASHLIDDTCNACFIDVTDKNLQNYMYGSNRELSSVSYASDQSTLLSSRDALNFRALKAMPDIGCPELLAGMCWWIDYSLLLSEAGLLESILTGKSEGTYGFGDGPQRPALLKAFQVPLFYKQKASNRSCIIFVNITIVENEVGLLNGKVDLAALQMGLKLSSTVGQSRFWLMDNELKVDDVGSHYWLPLDSPRSFAKDDWGFSLQKIEGQAIVKKVKASSHHALMSAFDSNILDDNNGENVDLKVADSNQMLIEDAPLQKLSADNTSVSLLNLPTVDPGVKLIMEEPSMGVFEEVFSSDRLDFDSDDDFEFNEESETYERDTKTLFDTSVRFANSKNLYGKSSCDHNENQKEVRNYTIELSTVQLSPEKVKELVSRLWHLHRAFNHPSTGQLLSLLQNSMPEGVKLPAEVSRAVANLNCPQCAVAARGNKTPVRPKVSIPLAFAPGEFGHLDVGHFDSPRGKFVALVHSDAYSSYVASSLLNDVSAESVVRSYIDAVSEHYSTITADLGSLFDSDSFKTFLSRIGSVFTFVPTGAHWHNRSEKAIHLIKIELQKVFLEFPTLENASALKLATMFLNKRVMPQYKMTRTEIHLGRLAPKISLSEELFSQAPAPLPPNLSDVELFLDVADRKRTDKGRKEAHIRIAKALKEMKSTAKDPISLRNGDQFLIFHEGRSKSTSGFRGPFICLGQVRSLVVGMSGRKVVTAHPSRILLHKRTTHDLALDNAPNGVLPPTRKSSWELPLDSGLTEEDDDYENVGLPEPSIEDIIASTPIVLSEDTMQKENRDMKFDDDKDLGSILEEAPITDTFDDVDTFLNDLTSDSRKSIPRTTENEIELLDAPISVDNKATFEDGMVHEDTHISDSILRDAPLVEDESVHEDTHILDSVLQDAPISFNQEAVVRDSKKLDSTSDSRSVDKVTFDEPLFNNIEDPDEEILDVSSRLKRPREDDSAEDQTPQQKARLHLLRKKAQALGKSSRQGMLSVKKSSFPNPGLHCVNDIGFELVHANNNNFVTVYRASRGCMGFENVYMINNSRKRTVVLSYEEAIKVPGMKEAMASEIQNFKDLDVMTEEELSSLSEGTNAVTTRWVLSVKTNQDGSKKCKARLVARGFEDMEKDNITRDSPTASNATQRLVLQVLVQNQWVPHTWDFRSAFLQGKLLNRVVVLAPPAGFGIPVGKVWIIKKPVYGLVSAPKSRYDALMDVCREEGLNTDVSDEGVLRLIDENENIVGILALHVDDAIGGGCSRLFDIMKKVGEHLQIGALESSDTPSGLFYKGLRISTVWFGKESEDSLFHIFLDGNNYLDAIEPMPIPEGSDDEALLPKDMFEFRSLAGCIGYIATAFRPDVAIEASMLGRSFLAPTIATAKKANGILAYLQANRYHFTYKPGVKRLTVFADSAGPNEKGTQGGRLYFFTDELSEKICGIGHWESKKITRRCRSTNTGELLSVGAGHDSSIWLRQLWLEMTGKEIDIEIVTDSGGTGTNLATTKLPVERRNRIDMAILRQGLRRGEFAVTWVPSRANLSDVLTKEDDKRASDQIVVPVLSFKKTLLDSLRSGNTNLRGVRKLRRTKEDVSRY